MTEAPAGSMQEEFVDLCQDYGVSTTLRELEGADNGQEPGSSNEPQAARFWLGAPSTGLSVRCVRLAHTARMLSADGLFPPQRQR